MDNIIENILAIDQSAVQLIERSEAVKNRILEETALERARLLEESRARLESKVAAYRDGIEEELAVRISEIDKQFLEQKAKLKSDFNAKRPAYENAILDRLIRGEE